MGKQNNRLINRQINPNDDIYTPMHIVAQHLLEIPLKGHILLPCDTKQSNYTKYILENWNDEIKTLTIVSLRHPEEKLTPGRSKRSQYNVYNGKNWTNYKIEDCYADMRNRAHYLTFWRTADLVLGNPPFSIYSKYLIPHLHSLDWTPQWSLLAPVFITPYKQNHPAYTNYINTTYYYQMKSWDNKPVTQWSSIHQPQLDKPLPKLEPNMKWRITINKHNQFWGLYPGCDKLKHIDPDYKEPFCTPITLPYYNNNHKYYIITETYQQLSGEKIDGRGNGETYTFTRLLVQERSEYESRRIQH